MNKKKLTGIIGRRGDRSDYPGLRPDQKNNRPRPRSSPGEDRTEEAANSGNEAVDTGIRSETDTQAESIASTVPDTSVDTSASSGLRLQRPPETNKQGE